jgi:formate dehydrogenase major subunit
VIDPLATETASFWENHGQYINVDPTKIQTEVFRLPTTCFAEEDGSLTNSGRWLQWHWKGADGPGESRSDILIMSDLFLRLRGYVPQRGRRVPRSGSRPALVVQTH